MEKAFHSLPEAGLELAHPRHEIEIEIRRQQPEPFVRPRQRDLVEVLPDLAGERTQLIELVCAAQQLLVVSARALVRPMLIRDIAADLAVVFDGRPDADVDGGEHCPFGNHRRTSRYSTPKRTNSGVWVMAESRAAASRMAITRISVGIRSR